MCLLDLPALLERELASDPMRAIPVGGDDHVAVDGAAFHTALLAADGAAFHTALLAAARIDVPTRPTPSAKQLQIEVAAPRRRGRPRGARGAYVGT
jgi:hypothetical protein